MIRRKKRILTGSIAQAGMTALLIISAAPFTVFASEADTAAETAVLPYIDMTKWEYNEQDHVYWQKGISYCAVPADTEYETIYAAMNPPESYDSNMGYEGGRKKSCVFGK